MMLSQSRIRIKSRPKVWTCSYMSLSASSSFLVSLSPSLVLQEPLPHLFNQMFCRLYLLRALRELYHSALESLNLPPIRQL